VRRVRRVPVSALRAVRRPPRAPSGRRL